MDSKVDAKFWLVWSPDGPTNPKYRHATRKDAEAEAIRLTKNTRKEFFVLEVVRSFKINDIIVTDYEEGVPF
jgi:hypothetical protein